jgi:hypothetical protein
VIERFSRCPPYVREQLAHALRTALLASPYRPAAAGALLGDSASASATATTLAGRGIICAARARARARALALDAAAHAAAQVSRPELVLTGPAVEELHDHDQVAPTKSSSRAHAGRCGSARSPATTIPRLPSRSPRGWTQSPTCAPPLINIGRRLGDTSAPAQLIAAFGERL